MVVLPELYASGYDLHKRAWRNAELERSSQTVKFVQETAKEHNIYIGCGFFETDGRDLFDTYVVGRPDGSLAAKVRKLSPATAETFFFKGGSVENNPHYFDSEYGRMGVLICAEHINSSVVQRVFDAKPSLVLSPWAAPEAPKTQKFPQREEYRQFILSASKNLSKLGRVPFISANMGGRWEGGMPWEGSIYNEPYFPILSITNENGEQVSEDRQAEKTLREKRLIDTDENVLMGTITVDPRAVDLRAPAKVPVHNGRYIAPPPFVVKYMFGAIEFLGGYMYDYSSERKQTLATVAKT